MNRAVKLPDYIQVANIRDLFWNNNSDLYPTCVPTDYITIEDTRPTFQSPYLGTCVLRGEYNHSVYNGEFYFLTKLRVQDIEREEYVYQLDYDVMMNFLNRGVEVKGTLIKTNREDILEGCLQTTVPILADPINKKIYSPKKRDKKKVDIKYPDDKKFFKEWVDVLPSKTDVDVFIKKIKESKLGRAINNKQCLRDDKNSPYSKTNPLIILDYLRTSKSPIWWKLNLYKRFKKWLITNKDNLVLVKQSSITDHFNDGKYVVGKRNETVGGNISSERWLASIDLSTLSDIVPIDNSDPEYRVWKDNTTTRDRKHPNKEITYDLLPDAVDIDVSLYQPRIISNIPYLPISPFKTLGCIEPLSNDLVDYCSVNDWKWRPPRIPSHNGGFYWYLEKNNIPLVDNATGGLSVALDDYFNYDISTKKYESYDETEPLGFVDNQIVKKPGFWDGFEYIGETPLTKVKVRKINNGISVIDKLNSQRNKDPWFLWAWHASGNSNLSKLWGKRETAFLHLYVDGLRWLSILPSYAYKGSKSYKYYWNDYWKIWQYFPQLSSKDLGYPGILYKADIKFGTNTFKTPKSINKLLEERNKRLDDISSYKTLLLGRVIRKGYLWIDRLEYGFGTTNNLRAILPYTFTDSEWSEISTQQISFQLSEEVSDRLKSWQQEIESQSEKIIWAGFLSGISLALAPLTFGATLVCGAAGVGALVSGINTNISNQQALADYVLLNGIDYSRTWNLGFGEGGDVVIFYHYKGKLQVGNISRERVEATVDNEGKTSIERISRMIIPMGDHTINYKNQDVVEPNFKNILVKLIKGGFYSSTKSGWIHHYDEETLSKGTNTFDLVGTNWYLLVHNGKFNLIPKNNDPIPETEVVNELIEIKGTPSTYVKINQKSNLNYYGQLFNLNTKFRFSQIIPTETQDPIYLHDQFIFISKHIEIKEEFADPDVEYLWLSVREPNDNIDYLLSIPRKQSRYAEKVDSSQVLMMKERLLQTTMNYEQDKYANELMMGDKRLTMARQREDLTWQRTQAGINIGTKVAVSGLGLAAAAKGGAGALPMATGAFAATASLASDISFLIRYPTLMKRVDEDERNLLLANSQQLYQRKQNYEHDFKFQTLKLNKIAGSYQKPVVTNRDAQEQYNKERGVEDIHIEIYLPSETQKNLIHHIYNTFGCECISDHFEETPLEIKNGMSPGLYRFSKLQSSGITSSITDTTLRDILRQILENGVKFEGCEIEVEPPKRDIYISIPETPKIVFDPENAKDWPREKWDLYKFKTKDKDIIDALKKLPNYGLTDEEYEANKDKFKDIDDETLLNYLDQIISGRQPGQTIIVSIPKPQPTQEQVDSLNQTITDLQNQITTLQEQIQTNNQTCEEQKQALQAQLTQCQQQHSEITKDKETKEGQITVIQGQINALTLEKLELEKQLTECRNQIKRLVAAQKLCDEINTAEIKRLKEELAKCKKEEEALSKQGIQQRALIHYWTEQKLEAEKALKTCEANLAAKEAEITNLKTQLTNLENRPTQEAINNLQTELTNKTKQLEELQKQCDEEKTQLEKTKKDLEAEIHQHKVDKEDLTQQLNNERRRAINEEEEINKLKKMSREELDRIQSDYDSKVKALEGQLNTQTDKWTIEKQQLTEKFKKQLEDLQKAIVEFSIHGSDEGAKRRIKELEEKVQEIELEKASADERYAAKQRELEQCRIELDQARKAQPTQTRPAYDNCPLMKDLMNDQYAFDLKIRDDGWSAFIDLVIEIATAAKWEGRTELMQKLMNTKELHPFFGLLEELERFVVIDKAIEIVKEPGWSKYLKWKTEGGSKNGDVDKVISKFTQLKDYETNAYVNGLKGILDHMNYEIYKFKTKHLTKYQNNQDVGFLLRHIYPGKTLDLYKALYGDPNIAITRKRFYDEVKCVEGGTGSSIQILEGFKKNITTEMVTEVPEPPAEPTEEAVKKDVPTGEVQIRIKDGLVFKPTDDQPYRQLRNLIPNFNEAVKGQWTSEPKYDYTWLIWNYKYSRYINYTGGITSSSTNSLIWLKQKVGNKEQSGRYIISSYIGHGNPIVEGTENLWNNRNKISIDNEFLTAVRNGTQKVELRLNLAPTFSYSTEIFKYELTSDFISDLDNLGLLEDFIKMSVIMCQNIINWVIEGRDYSDNYVVYDDYGGLNTTVEELHLPKVTKPLYSFNRYTNGIWLFPSEHTHIKEQGGWFDVYGNKHTDIGFNGDTSLYQYVRWFYEVATGSKSFIHPWKIGAGGALAFLKALDLIYKNQ